MTIRDRQRVPLKEVAGRRLARVLFVPSLFDSRCPHERPCSFTNTARDEHPHVDEVLGKQNLSSTYRKYKKDTEYIAGWLAHTAKQCGYEVETAQPEQQPSGRKKGKARKAAKPTPSTKDAPPPNFIIRVADFRAMAEAIASFKPRVDVPGALEYVFNRAIEARRKVWTWWEASHSGSDSNKRHSHFIGILEAALDILKPLIPRESRINTDDLEHLNLRNRFDGLAVEETDPYDDLIPEVKQSRLPKVAPVSIEQDEEGLEEEFFFAIESFLKELEEVRLFIFGEWIDYKESGAGLTRAAILANTAVDLVRSAENQFEQMLFRPKKYPAKDFPVWTLPALLFYHVHENFHDKPPNLFVNPSMRMVPENVLHDCDQQRYCMFDVYGALKVYTHLVETKIFNTFEAVTPQKLPHLSTMTYFALEWAQIAHVATSGGGLTFGMDEMMRGIKHMLVTKEVNIWVTFAMQLHIDISAGALGHDKEVSMPFNEYKAFVQETMRMWEGLEKGARPFLDHKRASHTVAELTTRTNNVITHHRRIALEDAWGYRTQKMKTHEVIGKTLDERDWVMKMSPWRCGLLKYELELQLHHAATGIEYLTADIMMLCWLYVVGSRILYPDAPRWPDMEFMLQRQDPDHLFHGGLPKTLAEAGKKLDLARGESALNHASNRRNNKVAVNQKNFRRFKDPSVLARPFIDRIGHEPESTADAHKWASRLASLMCDPSSQKTLDRQENLPIGTYDTSAFLKSLELQRKPKPLLTELRYWLLADSIDEQFNWWSMSQTCIRLWNKIIPALKEDPLLRDHHSCFKRPDLTVIRVIESAFMTEQLNLPSPTFMKVWTIIQDFFIEPRADANGDKYWGGDTELVGLIERWGQLAVPFANPGSINFMNLYANWDEGELKESRFGQAVWSAMHNMQRKNAGEEQAGTDSEEDEIETDEEDDNEDTSSIASDESSFSATAITLDLNKIGASSSNNVMFVNNQGKMISGPRDKLIIGPNNSFGFAPTPDTTYSRHNKCVELSRITKSKSTPKNFTHEAKPFSQVKPALEDEGEKVEGCECGHSNFAMSSRPISTMAPLAKAKDGFEHRCMGKIFKGVEVRRPGQRSNGVKVEKIRIPMKKDKD
ncbi:hypothetical protein BDV96DRAFT_655337 [Lophiotrema nucula]|uniref:DUF6604 domain-containing protein n=1 Tax=Lophiotrema nucula TaxID=690887 RepID=A0A6A5YFQ2_9PLEO|nr:hypothetical protein BDV96DRAFT_655337 [Lophiotrema nucula]